MRERQRKRSGEERQGGRIGGRKNKEEGEEGKIIREMG
jgi:hypothetical protein